MPVDYQNQYQNAITFPPSASVPTQSTTLQCQSSIVVIGANGAGKSRLGSWLEFQGPQRERVHRIAAQRSIVFPESTSPISLRSARETFHWALRPTNWDEATYEANKASLRTQARYGSMTHIETAPINDFEKLLTLLFSESYTNLLAHETAQRKSTELVPMPDNLLRRVQEIWETLLPHRMLQILGGEIRATPTTGSENGYPARAMSDGERVIFYLIAQCLCASENAIIVVDEPELHLHKSIQDRLWTAIERTRSDCIFIYLTHDLAFAVDRTEAVKVCLTGYQNSDFSWFVVDPQSDIPEEIYLEVLGSRQGILFVEGTSVSHDLEMYKIAYPDLRIKPVGGCSAVIAATKAFQSLPGLHRIFTYGLVDRDYLACGQLAAYERSRVFAPRVAEVENLYLVPDLIKAVASQLLLDVEGVFTEVKGFIMQEFKRAQVEHAMGVTRHRIALGMGQFSSKGATIDVFETDLQEFLSTLDAKALYSEAYSHAQSLIEADDYEGVLLVFNKKDLAKNISRFFQIKNGTYIDKVREMVKRGVGDVPRHIRAFLPDLRIEAIANSEPLIDEVPERDSALA
jgi:ABC-type dipeptide/oligopeptide/nickel transport system ATPase component